MTLSNSVRGRGRPRAFDLDVVLTRAQALFHRQGYDEVSIADLCAATGLTAPSLYAAFGGKAGLFERVLEIYRDMQREVIGRILSPGRPEDDAISDLLDTYARAFGADPERLGCLALEGARCSDPQARAAALSVNAASRDAIAGFLGGDASAAVAADFAMALLTGLSAQARQGMSENRRIEIARIGAEALGRLRPARAPRRKRTVQAKPA